MTRTIDEALTIAPHSPKVYEVAAGFNNAIGNLAKAETYYRRATSLAPSDPNKHLALFIHLQRFEGSNPDQHLRTALEKAASLPDAFVGIGMALVILDRLDEAEAAYRSGLDIDPNISALWYNLGNLLRRKGRYEESYAAFAKAAAINPNDPEIYCNLGNACHRVGKHEDALRHIKTAIRLDPNYALPHNSLAAILQHLGQEAEAQAAHRRFLDLSQVQK
jgi:tetratricopeptide (TPR) repeat protein